MAHMGRDFYAILGVSPNANDTDLKRVYRKLAMQWHPDKNLSNRQEAEETFKQITEAYEVLSDPRKRQAYDLFGEDGLKTGVTPNGENFRYKTAEELFSELFRESSLGRENSFNGSFGGSVGGSFNGSFGAGETESTYDGFPGNGSAESLFGGPRRPKKDQPFEVALPCSLEELYNGTKKRMKIARTITGYTGTPQKVSEVLTIDVKPGWRKGTKVIFNEKGDEKPGTIPADVVFVVEEREHSLFRREGSDLIYTHKLTLLDSLCGTTILISHLDNRQLTVTIGEVISPNSEKIVLGEGMPTTDTPNRRGNLKIRFDIIFPKALSDMQRQSLRSLLPTK